MIVLKLGGSILSEGLSPTLLADIKKTLEVTGSSSCTVAGMR